ncbi:G-D-S-L family lipolytic protein [Vibrio breoganii]|uniref:G-D-S-L family lipolytic protein n=1 Tax=Vibrio breoganii TaxID=553239 RepID=A0AAN1CRU4_9VIBR|nr:SGNH/GDSL hydrolase family protein [Vibrio breoganii]ANO32509.1 G-D-S-L family lipolytic protein [Vibrio breoganii]OED94228.1 G-D-S-L family lipolytic protein [Vibrio breoganii ZF-29]OEF84309.1 G-D-S-L family lipolytic protein [Vibrio breoganii 1C10]PMG01582.1 G-D-S-L family lipolytic protein [Vibrio breoganii]PMG78565.1 G-D-S-L family lipolytic protein [Vibrio breoganii]
MTTVLCFGDSNTWGYSPDLPRRYNENERWPMLLQQHLSPHYRIIEEGQNSRTTTLEDPYAPGKKGLDYLLPCLESHHPDLVVILLGTNDLKSRFSVTASDISKGAARLVEVVQKFEHAFMKTPPQVLLVSPAWVFESSTTMEGFTCAEEKSKQLAHYYQLRSQELGCHFLDAATFIKPCAKEGIHWPADQHKKFAQTLSELVPKLMT